MQRCIQLAKLGTGFTAPNPMVGAVLVYEHRIIGEGYHQYFGGPHAEVNCINSVAIDDRQFIPLSTLYVSLEPCAHYGKTPPCAELVIAQKIPHVVIGCTDSFDQVNGKGVQLLLNAGIKVTMPVLEQKCKELNRVFFTFHQKKRPYIVLKWAQTADGFIAPNNTGGFAISTPLTQVLVHRWRSEYAAIGVGFNTVVLDNPQLNNRLWPNGKQPIRVILDPHNELPCDRNIFDGASETLIYNQHASLDGEMTQWIKITSADFLEGVMQNLFQRNITSLLIEGGAKTLQSFIDVGLYDAIFLIENEQLLHEGVAAPKFTSTTESHIEKIGTDSIHYYYFDKN